MAEVFVEQHLHPYRHTQPTLGDQLGWQRCRDRARATGATASSLIAAAANPAAIGLHLDLELFGVLGAAGRQRQAALSADLLRRGQRADFLAHGQKLIVAARWP